MPQWSFGWLAEGVDFLGEIDADRTPGDGLFNIETMEFFGIEPQAFKKRFDAIMLERYNAPTIKEVKFHGYRFKTVDRLL